MGSLPRDERRILVLRANLGGSQARSRNQVAALLGMSAGRVRSLEQRGLGDLHRAADGGTCSASGDFVPGPVMVRGMDLTRIRLLDGRSAGERPHFLGAAAAGAGAAVSAVGEVMRRVVDQAGRAVASYSVGTDVAPVPYRWLVYTAVGVGVLLLALYLGYEVLDVTDRLHPRRYRRAQARTPPAAGLGMLRDAEPTEEPDQPPPVAERSRQDRPSRGSRESEHMGGRRIGRPRSRR